MDIALHNVDANALVSSKYTRFSALSERTDTLVQHTLSARTVPDVPVYDIVCYENSSTAPSCEEIIIG